MTRDSVASQPSAVASSSSESARLRVLWVATKSPWPPEDGGRLLLLQTLEAVARAGVEVWLLAPAPERDSERAEEELARWCQARLVRAKAGSRLGAAFKTLWGPEPWSLVRHRWPALRQELDRLLQEARFDLAVAEQFQAFPILAAARETGIPTVLRAQNVESALWRQCSGQVRGIPPVVFGREARRMAAAEAEAVRHASWVVALSEEDAGALAQLGGSARHLAVLAPPFPTELPPGPALEGTPALVAFGSAGWLPNRQADERLERSIWPVLREAFPKAVLHRFGNFDAAGAGTRLRPGSAGEPASSNLRIVATLPDSRLAFPENGILLLPLLVASGVRMRILEAWARGIPVVATPEAAVGLRARDGEELLLARTPEEFGGAVERLVREPGLRDRLRSGGRAALRNRHDPVAIGAAWRKLFLGLRKARP